MSLFRKPKKTIQRRVFSTYDDEDGDHFGSGNCSNGKIEKMDVDDTSHTFGFKKHEKKDKFHDKKVKNELDSKQPKTKSLLSFADDDEEDEIFQVRKSSHSKKVMRMMDKERRKKRAKEGKDYEHDAINQLPYIENGLSSTVPSETATRSSSTTSSTRSEQKYSVTMSSSEQSKSKKSDKIQTEIRTDDFVLVVKMSEPELILNGRAALCAGKDDMSDEDNARNSDDESDSKHMFSKPEHLKQMLESGSIPDAAMIHAARKRRQKAREQGDIIPVEEPKDPPTKGKRLNREDVEVENSDEEERVDMNAITGKKELEERREQFYSVENDYSDDDSDRETNEWENQQIRKGVTGAQLVTAQQESVLSRFMIKSATNQSEYTAPQSTSTLLDEAYAKNSLEKPRQLVSLKSKKESKVSALRTPQEISESLKTRLVKLKELNEKHKADIERITGEVKVLKLEEMDCAQKAPTAAAKYRFYQEINGYVSNLVECLNEKAPKISELEKRALSALSRHPVYLIERRRQDVRDQVKEMTESSKCLGSAQRRGPDYEDIIKRTAERECRRTRRRCEREKNDTSSTHLDGMSSDDEVSDRFMEQKKTSIDQLEVEVDDLFVDACDEFCKPELILSKFNVWRKTDMESYKDAFVSLCLPKIMGPLIRTETLVWNPLNEESGDIENMNWYSACMLYGWSENETEETLAVDPDLKLVPTIIEKIFLPKITEIINNCWDPMSTTQNLRLIGLINRIGRDYPIREYSSPLRQLFNAILDKMKSSLDNDVFIPIFPKQVQEARTSFFQRQFCSALKLFRNFLSWQGILADKPLRDLAISSLLNRYLLLALRVCSANDALSKAYIIVNTLPTAWLQPESETLESLKPLISFIKSVFEAFDSKNPLHMQSCDKAKQILQRLHSW